MCVTLLSCDLGQQLSLQQQMNDSERFGKLRSSFALKAAQGWKRIKKKTKKKTLCFIKDTEHQPQSCSIKSEMATVKRGVEAPRWTNSQVKVKSNVGAKFLEKGQNRKMFTVVPLEVTQRLRKTHSEAWPWPLPVSWRVMLFESPLSSAADISCLPGFRSQNRICAARPVVAARWSDRMTSQWTRVNGRAWAKVSHKSAQVKTSKLTKWTYEFVYVYFNLCCFMELLLHFMDFYWNCVIHIIGPMLLRNCPKLNQRLSSLQFSKKEEKKNHHF